jgi:hypothetical protein
MSLVIIGTFWREESSILEGREFSFEVTSHACDAARCVTMALYLYALFGGKRVQFFLDWLEYLARGSLSP